MATRAALMPGRIRRFTDLSAPNCIPRIGCAIVKGRTSGHQILVLMMTLQVGDSEFSSLLSLFCVGGA